MIDAVAVVVPAHDEVALLPDCLAAIDVAMAALPPAIRRIAVVVLDACSDHSACVAERWVGDRPDRGYLAVQARNVGRARAAGMCHALDRLTDIPRARTWLATTDADSAVPSSWLVDQLQMARDGAEAIAGSIAVTDWNGYPIGFGERFVQFYAPPGCGESHGHVHGANLGVRADAYLAVGGFAPLASGEDHALWNALHLAARRRMASRAIPVTTSARRTGRAPDGFSQFLRRLDGG